jgi:GrpB-like predicted nucleotidyltransferase (UPF0157 family)
MKTSLISKKERTRKVEVVAYDPHWETLFQSEKTSIAQAVGNNFIAAHHIGSTAIPFIKAKPIIDILLVVKNINRLDDVNEKMIAMDYEPMGEYGIAGRRFYFKVVNGARLFHVHAFQAGNSEIQRHLSFVEYLLDHPDIASQYSSLKEELAKCFPYDIESYVNGKNNFIKNIEAQARAKVNTLLDG